MQISQVEILSSSEQQIAIKGWRGQMSVMDYLGHKEKYPELAVERLLLGEESWVELANRTEEIFCSGR